MARDGAVRFGPGMDNRRKTNAGAQTTENQVVVNKNKTNTIYNLMKTISYSKKNLDKMSGKQYIFVLLVFLFGGPSYGHFGPNKQKEAPHGPRQKHWEQHYTSITFLQNCHRKEQYPAAGR